MIGILLNILATALSLFAKNSINKEKKGQNIPSFPKD